MDSVNEGDDPDLEGEDLEGQNSDLQAAITPITPVDPAPDDVAAAALYALIERGVVVPIMVIGHLPRSRSRPLPLYISSLLFVIAIMAGVAFTATSSPALALAALAFAIASLVGGFIAAQIA